MSEDAVISIELGHDEALVLFELLADFYSQANLHVPTAAERLALVRLHGALEKTLVDPFKQDYQELINRARERLIAQSG